MSATPDAARAAALLERLLVDPDFRRRFRADPAGACADAGLAELGGEIARRGKALETLELRESRSSVAGVIAAAAAEAAGIVELIGHLRDGSESVTSRALEDVLTRHLPAVKDEPPQAARPRTAPDDAPRARGAGAREPEPSQRRGPAREPGPRSRRPASEPEAARVRVAAEDRGPALLQSRRLEAWDDARADLAGGKVDPRLVAILDRLLERHRIGISVIASGHDKYVAGGSSISNHFYGRGLDIATVDGSPVGPGNPAAREVMEELLALPKSLLPSEIGGPWNLAPPRTFSDGAHQNHIHVGFDDPPRGRVDIAVDSAEKPVDVGQSPQRTAVFAAVRTPSVPANTLAGLAAVEGSGGRVAAVVAGGVGGYPGDGASRERIAAWMAEEARRAGLPAELPVMAALQESGLRNLDHGDRDSVGFFQMRVSVWNRGEYAGYASRPRLQMRWFVEQALAVKAADPSVARDPERYGRWIADIERPALENRGRYQPHLETARQLIVGHG